MGWFKRRKPVVVIDWDTGTAVYEESRVELRAKHRFTPKPEPPPPPTLVDVLAPYATAIRAETEQHQRAFAAAFPRLAPLMTVRYQGHWYELKHRDMATGISWTLTVTQARALDGTWHYSALLFCDNLAGFPCQRLEIPETDPEDFVLQSLARKLVS